MAAAEVLLLLLPDGGIVVEAAAAESSIDGLLELAGEDFGVPAAEPVVEPEPEPAVPALPFDDLEV